MPLSPTDVHRIVETTGQGRDEFSRLMGGVRILRNDPITQACVFLDTESEDPTAVGLCSIHSIRPLGCRIYPMVLDESDESWLDDLCPHRDLFPEPPPIIELALRDLDRTLSR